MRLVPFILAASLICVAMPAAPAQALDLNVGFNLQIGTPDPQVIYVPNTSTVVVNRPIFVRGQRVIYVRERDRPRFVEALRIKHERERGRGKSWGHDRGHGRGHGHGHGHG